MSEIPEDAMKAAREVFDALNSPYRENPNTVDSDYDDDRVTIGRAIFAERERCARIAENEPRVRDADAGDPQHRIADKIRNP